MSVVRFGLGNLRQTDLTTFDCSLRRSATRPLMLAASCFFAISLTNVGFSEKHFDRNCAA
jgi:hypothetical protein